MKLTGILRAEWGDADRIHLAHGTDHWAVLCKHGNERLGFIKFGEYLYYLRDYQCIINNYEGWNFNSGNYLFTTDTK